MTLLSDGKIDIVLLRSENAFTEILEIISSLPSAFSWWTPSKCMNNVRRPHCRPIHEREFSFAYKKIARIKNEYHWRRKEAQRDLEERKIILSFLFIHWFHKYLNIHVRLEENEI